MKMSDADYADLKEKFSQALAAVGQQALIRHTKAVIHNGISKDIHKRVRWDLFWVIQDRKWRTQFCDRLYASGFNDSHLDTAFKKVVREIGVSGTVQSVLDGVKLYENV